MNKRRINIPKIRKFKYLIGFGLSFLFFSVLVISIFSIAVFTQFIEDYRVDTVKNVNVSLKNAQNEISQRLRDMQQLTFRVDRNFGFTYQPHDIPSDDRYNPVVQLRQYLEGNGFYSELGFYRYSEPDTVYLSEGEAALDIFQKYYVEFDGGKNAFLQREDALSVFPCRLLSSGSEAYTFVTSMPYNDKSPGKLLMFFVKKAQLDSIVQSAFGSLPVKLLLYDRAGKPIYTFGEPEKELLSVNPDDISGEKPSEQTLGGTKYLLFGAREEYNEWQYVAGVDLESLLSKYNNKRIAFTLTFCICLTVIFIFTILFALYNYSPIKRIINKINIHSGGQEEEYTSELDYIEATIDRTLKNRLLLQKKLVVSNTLWGQYENDSQALSALNEAGLLISCDTYRVCAVALSEACHHRAEEFLCLLEEVLDCKYISGAGIISGSFEAVVIINYDEARISSDELKELLRKFQVVCLTKYGERLTVGVGGAVKRIRQITESFRQASGTLLYFDDGDSDIILFDEITEKIEASRVPEYSSQIKRYIKSGRSEKAIEKFREIYEQLPLEDERLRYVFYNIIDSAISILEASGTGVSDEISGLIEMLISSRAGNFSGDIKDICVQLESLIAHTCSVIRSGKSKSENNDLTEKVMAIIDEKFCDNMLSLEGLAEACGVSPSHLGKFFKKAINTSPMQFVDQKRMEYVKKLLRETDESINSIVMKSGFIDVSNFIRKFKKLEGVTPAKYRSGYRFYSGK